MRSSYRDSELECYRIILARPGITREQVKASTHLDETTVRNALLRLWEIGAIDRKRGEPDLDRPNFAPYHYTALRGMEPFEEHQREVAARIRHKQLREGAIPVRTGVPRHKARDELMTKAEWEALFVNFELHHPGQGFLIIEEHLAMRAKQGEEPEIGLEDIPRLMSEVGVRLKGKHPVTFGRRPIVTPEMMTEARALLDQGLTYVQIAKRLGVKHGTLWLAMNPRGRR